MDVLLHYRRSVVIGLSNLILQAQCVGDSCVQAVEATIRSIHIHPNYANDPLNYNIALVELTSPVNSTSRHIKPPSTEAEYECSGPILDKNTILTGMS